MARAHFLPAVAVTAVLGSMFAACGDSGTVEPTITVDTYLKAYDDALCQ
jgi:hypothetical protein